MKWKIISLAAMLALVSCAKEVRRAPARVKVVCDEMQTRTMMPDEDGVWNINLFVYDGNSLPDEHIYREFRQPVRGPLEMELNTVTGRKCTIVVVANAGVRMPDYGMDEICQARWYMAYPDEYGHGMLRTGICRDATFTEDCPVEIHLERMMSKISLRMDRSELRGDVEMMVTDVIVGNTPRCASLLGTSSAGNASDLFTNGFRLSSNQAMPLNSTGPDGMSGVVTLYALENVQESQNRELGTFVELRMDYQSDNFFTDSGSSLIYRFVIHSGEDWSIRRNSHYHITVRPHADGLLGEDSWRVDKSGLSVYEGEPYMRIVPNGTFVDGTLYRYYYEMGRSEKRHFSISAYPPSMEVRLRSDLVEDELREMRARYTMDSDGRGFTVEAMGRSCATMMQLIPGPPLSEYDAETIMIQIE